MTRKYYAYLIISILLIPVIGIIAQGSSEKTNRKEIIMSQFDNSKPVPPPGFENNQYEKPSEEELRKKLNNLQFQVTQHEGTEQPFNNSFWDYHKDGIFVDIVSGEALFSSTDKFASGTGWPSFVRPLEPGNVVSEQDTSYGMVRTEVRSRYADSHLGHVFNDGPEPTGLRYCINSASLRFIPVKDLEKEGYGKYLSLFTEND